MTWNLVHSVAFAGSQRSYRPAFGGDARACGAHALQRTLSSGSLAAEPIADSSNSCSLGADVKQNAGPTAMGEEQTWSSAQPGLSQNGVRAFRRDPHAISPRVTLT